MAYIWLTRGIRPDHKTIAEFRRRHKAALVQVLNQCAQLCVELGLMEGNTLFVDGSKLRANASIGNSWTPQRCAKRLEQIDRRIAEILSECERADQRERQEGSMVKMDKELADQEALRAKVLCLLQKLEAEGHASINATDPPCTKDSWSAGVSCRVQCPDGCGRETRADRQQRRRGGE